MTVGVENVKPVMLDVPKKAVSIGTAAGLQLLFVLKSLLPGLLSQVALCAQVGPDARMTAAKANSATLAALWRGFCGASVIVEDTWMSRANVLPRLK
jgi:hypothetical protein